MLFSSTAFILGFLPVCLMGFFTFGRFLNARWALRWLVASSLFFYAWWKPEHLPLLIASVGLNYSIAWKLRHTACKCAWLTVGIALNLATLAWFKYANFLLHIVVPDAPVLNITLPLAISFFTFQQIMFLVDVSRGNRAITPSSNPESLLTYATFVTFFPHLIAGPIVRPSEIIPQFADPEIVHPRTENLADGLLIFLLGLGKKLVLADMFGGFADIGFDAAAHGAHLTFFEAWYATLSYALQIYFDFSGYSDMAIGLARMMNVRFPLNFDSPYQAANIADFWRRWHMTLGSFLRDYLYIPLGGNRAGRLRQTVNLMVTMLLCGLWHGAAWNFVIWGGSHGLLIVIHKRYRRVCGPMPAVLGQSITLFAVVLAWVPFRASSLDSTMAMLRGMAGFNGIALPRMIVAALPPLAAIIDPVTVLPFLGDARTLSFPEVSACLLLGWLIVLTLPNVHRMTVSARRWALTSSFALSMQALFFAPHVAPFLYFQF
jgi:alginate O-acetyltransferase complex protein AlgI